MKDAPHAEHTDHADSPENWRDARLAQALRHMPDAQAQPGARTRHAVLQHAQNAVAGTPTKGRAVDAVRRWWRGWWGSTASGARWSLALASLAVFGFMALLWQAQMVDMGEMGAGGERDRVGDVGPTRDRAAETAVVAGAPAPAPTPAPESARAPAGPPATASVLAQPKAARARVPAQAAPPAAAAPTPTPTLAKEPAAAALPAAPARTDAMADAKLEQRARADEAAAPLAVRILVGKRQSRLSLEQSGELLAQLRALHYGAAPGGLASAVGAVAQEGMVVEMEGQERWVIAPDHVEHHSRVAKDGDAAMNHSAITPEQYAQLLRLVNALLPR